MSSSRLCDYFINEYFVFNKSATKDQFFEEFKKISKKIPFELKNESLINALTHKSFSHEVKFELENNERLEFLGDAAIELIISNYILKKYPIADEGKLSKFRSHLVNETTLNNLALHIGLDSLVLLGKGEYQNKGYLKPSVLSDAFEAIVGAYFTENGFDKTTEVLLCIYNSYSRSQSIDLFDINIIDTSDPKSLLQEKTMKLFKTVPKYEAKEIKQGKTKSFEVTLLINDKAILKEINPSKKKAMQIIAQKTLDNKLYIETK